MDTRALTRPAAPRKSRITLTAGPGALAAARNEVRAAIRAWEIPVDPSVAVLLTGELVTNALGPEADAHGPAADAHGPAAGGAIELVVSCAYGQLQVDVYDSSPAVALPMDVPAGGATGHGLMLIASLASSCGYCRTPTGKAGHFTLMF